MKCCGSKISRARPATAVRSDTDQYVQDYVYDDYYNHYGHGTQTGINSLTQARIDFIVESSSGLSEVKAKSRGYTLVASNGLYSQEIDTYAGSALYAQGEDIGVRSATSADVDEYLYTWANGYGQHLPAGDAGESTTADISVENTPGGVAVVNHQDNSRIGLAYQGGSSGTASNSTRVDSNNTGYGVGPVSNVVVGTNVGITHHLPRMLGDRPTQTTY